MFESGNVGLLLKKGSIQFTQEWHLWQRGRPSVAVRSLKIATFAWVPSCRPECPQLAILGPALSNPEVSFMGGLVQPISATPLVVYGLAFRSPRSFAGVD
jgi:hypothetical protein